MRSLLYLSLCVGCAAEIELPPLPAEPLPPRFVTVSLEPQVLEAPVRELTTVDGGVDAVGVNGADHPVVVSQGRVLELLPGGPVTRTLFAAESDPTRLGSVHTITPRLDGGTWLASETGLFVIDAHYVWRSGWATSATQVIERPNGGLNGLWLVGDGLVRQRAEGGHRLVVSGLERVDALALTADGSRGFVTGQGVLRVLSSTDAGVVSEAPVPELTLTNVRSPVAGRTLLAAQADEGLVVFDARKDPAWKLFTGLTVRAMVADPASNALWVRTDSQLVVIDGDLARATPLDGAQGPLPKLVIDAHGDVLMPVADGVLRFKTGVERLTVGFEADVGPLITRRCVTCHGWYAERATFSPLAEEALSRVRSGDMPRCENGVRCKQPLPAVEAALLEGWVRGGKAP